MASLTDKTYILFYNIYTPMAFACDKAIEKIFLNHAVNDNDPVTIWLHFDTAD